MNESICAIGTLFNRMCCSGSRLLRKSNLPVVDQAFYKDNGILLAFILRGFILNVIDTPVRAQHHCDRDEDVNCNTVDLAKMWCVPIDHLMHFSFTVGYLTVVAAEFAPVPLRVNVFFRLGAGFADNPNDAPAELAYLKRGSSPAITRKSALGHHGAVIPLIIAQRRQAPQWRKHLRDFFYGDDHRSMGTSPIVAEIPTCLSARAASTPKLVRLLI